MVSELFSSMVSYNHLCVFHVFFLLSSDFPSCSMLPLLVLKFSMVFCTFSLYSHEFVHWFLVLFLKISLLFHSFAPAFPPGLCGDHWFLVLFIHSSVFFWVSTDVPCFLSHFGDHTSHPVVKWAFAVFERGTISSHSFLAYLLASFCLPISPGCFHPYCLENAIYWKQAKRQLVWEDYVATWPWWMIRVVIPTLNVEDM